MKWQKRSKELQSRYIANSANPLSPARAKILAQSFFPTLANINHQLIELDVCGTPQKIRLDQYLRYEIICKFCIRGCLRGDILGGSVGLGLFGQGYLTLGSNPLGTILSAPD